MSLQPFLDAPRAIQIHIIAALIGLVLGAFVLYRRKGTAWHRLAGRVWFVALATVAISGFFIDTVRTWGAFSPLHLFSVVTLGSLAYALNAARKGDIRAHEQTLKALYAGGMVFAGALTLTRDLTMSRIVFGEGADHIVSLRDLPGGIFGFTMGGALLIALFFALRGGRFTDRARR